MITLDKLPNGREATIVEVAAGCGLKNKLCCLNIRKGKKIKKITSQPFNGPVIVLLDDRQCAIGRGMARKIVVDEK